MKAVNELINQLAFSDFNQRYPNYELHDGKIHLLYVAPLLNGSGYYRAIAPCLEINQTSTHSAIITSLNKWDFTKQFDDYDNPIDERLIAWADYAILPALFSDVDYIMKTFASINPEIEFVMDLDYNYHRIPTEHPNFKKITKGMKDQLLLNISKMGVVTGVTHSLLHFYDHLLEKHYPESTVLLDFLPNLISRYGYESQQALKKNSSDKIRIGLVSTSPNAFDVIAIADILKKIQENYHDKIQLVVFGLNGEFQEHPDLSTLKVAKEKSVSFMSYFEKLNDLSLDIALLPSADLLYNTAGRSYIKYLELAAYAIPTIASAFRPYAEVIESQESGYLAHTDEQWMSTLDALISNESLRKRIGNAARKLAWSQHSFTSANLRFYRDVFI